MWLREKLWSWLSEGHDFADQGEVNKLYYKQKGLNRTLSSIIGRVESLRNENVHLDFVVAGQIDKFYDSIADLCTEVKHLRRRLAVAENCIAAHAAELRTDKVVTATGFVMRRNMTTKPGEQVN